MHRRHNSLLPICLLACLTTGVAQGQTVTDAQREALVIQARQGELAPSIDGLKTLYHQTRNARVREDLVALLVRANRHQEALAVCSWCETENHSDSELANLGTAARSEGDYEQALTLFRHLPIAIRQTNRAGLAKPWYIPIWAAIPWRISPCNNTTKWLAPPKRG